MCNTNTVSSAVRPAVISLNFWLICGCPSAFSSIRENIQELEDTEVLDEYRVALKFTGKQSRQLPLFVAALPIFSKRYYTAYDFSQSTLTAPLSSGPYKVGKHAVGRYIEYHRVADYWGNVF